MKSYYEATDIITEATLYLHQVHATRKFSFGTWTSRQHGGLEGMASGAGWFKRRRGD